MKILKFGGSSISSYENIKKVMDIITNTYKTNEKLAIVFSAFSGITDRLIETSYLAASSNDNYLELLQDLEKKHLNLIKSLIGIKRQSNILARTKIWLNELEDILHGISLIKELTPRTLDFILSFGERLSTYIICESFKDRHVEAEFVDARCLIKTDANFGMAKVLFDITFKNIRDYFNTHKTLQVITGFIASTTTDETTTLGRSGSDYTAALLGAALKATEIEIWSDVDGIMTANPRKVSDAFSIENITYEEAMEMSHFGAKVIYPPTILPVLERNIPIRIKNTFNPGCTGTLISKQSPTNDFPIKGISSIDNIALFRIQGSGMIGIAGIATRLFGALAKKDINIVLITQASSEHSICFAIDPQAANEAQKSVEAEFALEMQAHQVDKIIVENNLSIVAIVGADMRKVPGIAGKLFKALGDNNINVTAIAQGSSELNISVVINKKDEIKALNVVHDAFFPLNTIR